MATTKMSALLLNGRLAKDGITYYTRNGKTIMRSAYSNQPKRRTVGQFAARQQLMHSTRLWNVLKQAGTPMFSGEGTAYARFRSLMRGTPVVYLPKSMAELGATLLLPDMPVSDGVLPTVRQWLGEVAGQPALLTSLCRSDLHAFDTLQLYTLQQKEVDDCPRVSIAMRQVRLADFVIVDGQLAIVGQEFADPTMGWALVHVRGANCNSQTVVTACNYYQRYTTEEALHTAADSYGGLTPQDLLRPNA